MYMYILCIHAVTKKVWFFRRGAWIFYNIPLSLSAKVTKIKICLFPLYNQSTSWKSTFPMSPSVRPSPRSVCWSVCHNFLKRRGKFQFHAPIGELVLPWVQFSGCRRSSELYQAFPRWYKKHVLIIKNVTSLWPILSARPLVGHNFLKEQEVLLPCSYWSTCFYLMLEMLVL